LSPGFDLLLSHLGIAAAGPFSFHPPLPAESVPAAFLIDFFFFYRQLWPPDLHNAMSVLAFLPFFFALPEGFSHFPENIR